MAIRFEIKDGILTIRDNTPRRNKIVVSIVDPNLHEMIKQINPPTPVSVTPRRNTMEVREPCWFDGPDYMKKMPGTLRTVIEGKNLIGAVNQFQWTATEQGFSFWSSINSGSTRITAEQLEDYRQTMLKRLVTLFEKK